MEILCRKASLDDLVSLMNVERACFETDQMSKRSFRMHILSQLSDLYVVQRAEKHASVIAYGLVLYRSGTRLARLYSLAVLPEMRGLQIARKLIVQLEESARSNNRFYMRLEVASNNFGAIRLYESNGYRIFGEYTDYYQDHGNALRMQKKIQDLLVEDAKRLTPWYQQATDFTCGPAALMMAMASLKPNLKLSLSLEIQLWREATTVFMTSGHGGCHPFGLALAAKRRGFDAVVLCNLRTPLFVDSVRTLKKKQIMATVHEEFLNACKEERVNVDYREVSQQQVCEWLDLNHAVLVLISTYRLDGKKTPHWVVVTGIDNHCIYVHDPDLDEKNQLPIDCQHIPIALEDFDKMSMFGGNRLRVAVAIKL